MEAYRRVRRFWSELGYPVVTSDSDPAKPFNRSQARNAAVRKVATEMVIVADADTVGELAAIRKATLVCGGEVVWPYEDQRVVSAEWVDTPLDELWDKPNVAYKPEDGWHEGWGPVGLMVCRTATYWRLGGYDERFTTWGCEDTSFVCAACTLSGARTLPGRVVSFDHPRVADMRDSKLSLEAVYKAADGDPVAMEQLVADPARGVVASGVESWREHWPSPSPGVHWIGPDAALF
jgi:hypothetical protein